MLELIHEQFLLDPNRRWPWLAHAALLAKHRLRDCRLRDAKAAAIDRHTTAVDVPLWARQMEIFILEDMNELEAARIMLAACSRAAGLPIQPSSASSNSGCRSSSPAPAASVVLPTDLSAFLDVLSAWM